MADTLISALSAASALDATELYPASQGGNSRKVTGAQIQTMVRRAGTATAGSWPILGSGTVLGTAANGAEEFDGTATYFTVNATTPNRAVDLCEYFVCLSAEYTLGNNANLQKLFNATTNGTLTLPAGLYFFEAVYALRAMDAVNSTNASFDILGAGGATVTTVLYYAIGFDGNVAQAGAQTGSTSVTVGSASSIVTGAAFATLHVSIRGTFRVTVGGTIIPSIQLATAAAAIVRAGSYFRCRCVGASNATSCGNWT